MNLSFHAFLTAFNKPHYLMTRDDRFVIGFWEDLLMIAGIALLFLVAYLQVEWQYRKKAKR